MFDASLPHFDVIAVVGCDKVGAYQQQDNLGRLKVSINLPHKFLTRQYLSIMPWVNQTFSPKGREVHFEFIS